MLLGMMAMMMMMMIMTINLTLAIILAAPTTSNLYPLNQNE